MQIRLRQLLRRYFYNYRRKEHYLFDNDHNIGLREFFGIKFSDYPKSILYPNSIYYHKKPS